MMTTEQGQPSPEPPYKEERFFKHLKSNCRGNFQNAFHLFSHKLLVNYMIQTHFSANTVLFYLVLMSLFAVNQRAKEIFCLKHTALSLLSPTSLSHLVKSPKWRASQNCVMFHAWLFKMRIESCRAFRDIWITFKDFAYDI